jgi:transcriptional/translational regulatory protein YebC/TACO1
VLVEKDKIDEEKLLTAALEAGAEDVSESGAVWEVITAPETFEVVRDAIKSLGVELASAEVAMVPQNLVKVEGREAQQLLKLMEAIEDHDDVQHLWTNCDIDEKEIEASLA